LPARGTSSIRRDSIWRWRTLSGSRSEFRPRGRVRHPECASSRKHVEVLIAGGVIMRWELDVRAGILARSPARCRSGICRRATSPHFPERLGDRCDVNPTADASKSLGMKFSFGCFRPFAAWRLPVKRYQFPWARSSSSVRSWGPFCCRTINRVVRFFLPASPPPGGSSDCTITDSKVSRHFRGRARRNKMDANDGASSKEPTLELFIRP
jgi:hypothetical protein